MCCNNDIVQGAPEARSPVCIEIHVHVHHAAGHDEAAPHDHTNMRYSDTFTKRCTWLHRLRRKAEPTGHGAEHASRPGGTPAGIASRGTP